MIKLSGRTTSCLAALAVALGAALGPTLLAAQALPPERRYLFREDENASRRARDAAVKQISKREAPKTDEINIVAPETEFVRETGEMKATGGVIVSRSGVQAQASQARVNSQTKQSKLEGNVVVTTGEGVLSAETGDFNLDSETGTFDRAGLEFEQGSYTFGARNLEKYTEFDYRLKDLDFTTCRCEGDEPPWEFTASSAHVTQEGYAHCYNTVFHVAGVPIFYSPYLGFPVKTERSSGLLAPTYGYGNQNGVQFSQPIFAVIDDYSDLMITPFTESKTRNGASLTYRQAVSRYHSLEGKFLYSNESARDGNLRGTIVTDLFDKDIDTNRTGGYYSHTWRSEPGAEIPASFVADLHYVSDSVFPREIDDEKIADLTARYVTSTMTAGANFTEWLSGSITGEYSQAILSDTDVTFQRLPEVSMLGLKSFRPFGYNPYGLKLVSGNLLTVTSFEREDGFDGLRTNFNPQIQVPFHYQNYFQSQITFGGHLTKYDYKDETLPGSDTEGDFVDERKVFQFSYQMSTALERVFDVPSDSWLARLASYGVNNQDAELVRMKHTVEPFFRYSWVPPADQNAPNRLFDSLDSIRPRSLLLYGVRTSLFGRYLPASPIDGAIPELAPRVEDLPTIDPFDPLDDPGFDDGFRGFNAGPTLRKGAIRELAAVTLKQSYDYRIDENPDEDPGRRPFSDVQGSLELYPSSYFALKLDQNFDYEDHDFSSWAVSTHFLDDRGDAIRARYTFVDEQISQIEGNVELALHPQLKLGYYTRFDDRESEFIENRGALRLLSDCDCWHIDFGVSDRINPDNRQFLLSFTLGGLGDISQKITRRPDANTN